MIKALAIKLQSAKSNSIIQMPLFHLIKSAGPIMLAVILWLEYGCMYPPINFPEYFFSVKPLDVVDHVWVAGTYYLVIHWYA